MILTDPKNIRIEDTFPKTTHNNDPHFKSFGIRGRLFIGFGLLILLFITSICINLVIISQAKTSAQLVINKDLPTFYSFLNLGSELYHAQSTLRGMGINNDIALKKEYDQTMLLINKTENEIDNLSHAWTNTAIQQNWQQVKSLLMQIKEEGQKLGLANTTMNTNVNALATASKANTSLNSKSFNTINSLLNTLMDILDGPLTASGERAGGVYDLQYSTIHTGTNGIINNMNFMQHLQYILIALGVIVSVIIVLLTSNSIIHHINVFREHSNKIAAGDLRQTLTIHGHDELAELGSDLNSMTENLASIAKQISTATHNMVSSLEEVKQAVNSQSTGASEQASSINEITASLEEIEKSSAQTMEKAKALGSVAERTQTKGSQGLQSVEQSIMGMKEVREKVQLIAQTILDLSNQTQQVGEITTAVNALAQQSKMLALNASIEAAKAGDAGKGFAVVAAEVKNLAEQSEQSTTQVQKILEDIRHATEKAVMITEEGTKGVDHGASLVEQTGEIVRSLSTLIEEATIASQQIEAAVRQEGVGIEQITAGMNEINQVTSSFVASAKQTLEAITNLSNISRQLKEQVDTYKV